jgi:hypothetical protein
VSASVWASHTWRGRCSEPASATRHPTDRAAPTQPCAVRTTMDDVARPPVGTWPCAAFDHRELGRIRTRVDDDDARTADAERADASAGLVRPSRWSPRSSRPRRVPGSPRPRAGSGSRLHLRWPRRHGRDTGERVRCPWVDARRRRGRRAAAGRQEVLRIGQSERSDEILGVSCAGTSSSCSNWLRWHSMARRRRRRASVRRARVPGDCSSARSAGVRRCHVQNSPKTSAVPVRATASRAAVSRGGAGSRSGGRRLGGVEEGVDGLDAVATQLEHLQRPRGVAAAGSMRYWAKAGQPLALPASSREPALDAGTRRTR